MLNHSATSASGRVVKRAATWPLVPNAGGVEAHVKFILPQAATSTPPTCWEVCKIFPSAGGYFDTAGVGKWLVQRSPSAKPFAKAVWEKRRIVADFFDRDETLNHYNAMKRDILEHYFLHEFDTNHDKEASAQEIRHTGWGVLPAKRVLPWGESP